MDAPEQVQISPRILRKNPDIDPFGVIAEQNANAGFNDIAAPSEDKSETQTPVAQTEPLPPDEMAERQMMAMRAQIEAARAQAQVQERGDLSQENTVGAFQHEDPTSINTSDSDAQMNDPAARRAFFETPEGQEQIRLAVEADPATMPEKVLPFPNTKLKHKNWDWNDLDIIKFMKDFTVKMKLDKIIALPGKIFNVIKNAAVKFWDVSSPTTTQKPTAV